MGSIPSRKRKKITSAIRRNRRTKWRNEDRLATGWCVSGRTAAGRAASWWDTKASGDSIFRYISAPTQKELSAKLRQLTEAYKGVDLTEESNMALSVWLDKWLDEYMAAALRPTTLNGYRRSLELHVKPYLGNKTLSKITAVDLRSLYRSLQETGRVHSRDGQSPGLSARTVHGIHTTLHHALKTAMEQNLIPNNPAAEVDPPKFDRRAHESPHRSTTGRFYESH